MPFTVQDTRRVGRPVPLDDAPAPIYASSAPDEARLAHAAASTGVPGWCTLPRVTDPAEVNCRVVAVAAERSDGMSRAEILAAAPTLRTGIMPVRLGFGDRVAALIMLLHTAFRHQLAAFRCAQPRLRAEGQRLGAELLPEDLVEFDFLLPWRELRAELTTALRHHYEACVRLSQPPQQAGLTNAERERLRAIAQRTAPDQLLTGLSAMALFDLDSWGALEAPFEAVPDATPPAWARFADLPVGACDGANVDNGSFIPSPGVSSRPESPATTCDGSFGFGASPTATTPPKPERPPRPASLAEALDPEAQATRQAALVDFRAAALRAACA